MWLAEAGRGAVAVAAVPLAAAGIGRGWQVLAQLRSPAWGLSHFHFLWLSGPGRQALGVLWAAGAGSNSRIRAANCCCCFC